MISNKYTRLAILLHWMTAAAIVALFVIGWYMVELPKGPARGATFALHKSIGLSVLLLTVWRLTWRLRHPPPDLLAAMPAWQRGVATSVHRMFYLLLFLQPLTGYLSSSFSGYGTALFGLPLPQWGWPDPPLNEFFTELHVAGSLLLLGLVATHVAGALSHAIAPGDRQLRRMLPWD